MRSSGCRPARGKGMAKGGFVPFGKKGADAKAAPMAKGKGKGKPMPPWMSKKKK